MRNFYLSLLLLAGLFLQPVGLVHAATEVNTSYVITNQEQLGVTRAFDDGQNTVVVFADVESQKPLLTDKDGKAIRAERVGDYLVLPGLFDEVHVHEGALQGVLKLANFPQAPTPLPPKFTASENSVSSSVTAPVSTTAETAPSKPGTAIYPIPYAKQALPKTAEAQSGQPLQRSGQKVAQTSVPASSASISMPQAPHPEIPHAAPNRPWRLKQGYPIGDQLKAWGQQAHWDVVWNYPTDIVAPADYIAPSGDFEAAAEDVINTLAANGALIHYRAFFGNNTFLVFGTGAATP